MRKICYAIILLAVCLVSCNNTDDLWDEVDDLKSRVTSLETQIKDLNANIEAIRELAKEGATITSVEEKDGAYKVTMSDGKILNLVQQTETTNLLPVIGIDEEGYWIVSYNGETPKRVKDTNGNDIKAKGENGVTPKFSVDAEGYWMIQYGSSAPERVKDVNGNDVKATGDAGSGSADSFFETVEKRANELYIKLKTGQEMTIPIVSNFSCVIDATGTQSFTAGEVKTFNVTMKGVDNTMIAAPSGWKAELSKDELKPDDATTYILKVTAPTTTPSARAVADNSKDIAILATSGAYAVIAKIQVEVKLVTDFLTMYLNGETILETGNIRVNLTNYPNHETLEAGEDLFSMISGITAPTILFLSGADEFKISSTTTVSAPIVIISQKENEQATFDFLNAKYFTCKEGSLVMNNLKIKAGAQYLFNSFATGTTKFTDLIIDNCNISNITKSIFFVGTTTVGITNITIANSKLAFSLKTADANIQMFNPSNSPFTSTAFKSFTLSNNTLYNAEPAKIQFLSSNSTTTDESITCIIKNNSFINLKGSNIFIKVKKGDITYEKNIFSVFTDNTYTSYFYEVTVDGSVATEITDNIVYDNTKMNWAYASSASTQKPANNIIPRVDSNPFTDSDFVNGVFTKDPQYAEYGAK